MPETSLAAVRLVVATVLLAALLVVWLAGGRRGQTGPMSLFLLALGWLLLNKPLEGVVLFRLAEDRGVTQSDLLGLVAVATALLRSSRIAVSARADRLREGRPVAV